MAADNFTQIANALFRDPRLSFKAKGIFGLISTHRNGFKVTLAALVRASKDGPSAVTSGLKELEQFGYLERGQDHNQDGTFAEAYYRITDVPAHLFDLLGEDAADALEKVKNRRSEPFSENPHTGNPHTENRSTKNTNTKKTKKEEDEEAPQAARSAPDVPQGPHVGSAHDARERAKSGSAASAGSSTRTRSTTTVPGPRVDMRPIHGAVAPDLASLLPQPWPASIAADVAAALRGGPTVGHERTIEQVAARVADRWYTHGYAQAVLDGQPIRRPVGVLRALIAPPKCTAPRCEDGEDIDTGVVCRTCVERDAEQAAERAASRKPLRAV